MLKQSKAALGRQLQTVLVNDLDIAEKVVDALRKDNLGEASLIAADALAADQSASKRSRAPLGSMGWAADMASCSEKKLQPLMDRLLGHVLVAEDLNTALRLRKKAPDCTIATLNGELVTREGIIQGGATGDESVSVLKRQAEIRELSELTVSLHAEVDARQTRRDQLNKRVDQLEDSLAEARERLQRKRVSSSTLEGKLALIERDLNQLANKIESLEWERKELEERGQRIEEILTKNRQERDLSLRKVEELEKLAETTTATLTEARKKEDELTEMVTEARTNLAVETGTQQNLEEQRAPMVERLEEFDALIARCHSEIASFEERIEQGRIETVELQKNIVEWESESVERNQERDTILAERSSYSDTIEEGEAELTKLRKDVQAVAERRGKEEVKVAQLDLQIENLEQACRERYRAELEMFEPDSHALLSVIEAQKENARRKNSKAPQPREFSVESESDEGENIEDGEGETFVDPAEPDWEFVEETVAYLRTRLDSMGPVNLDAIEEFDELEEHYSFNMRQLEDLENSRDELLRMIAKINRETRKMFSETFEKVRRNFRDMFKELFGDKAKADLVLMDDADPLECGIDIIAKPPGKKLQSISLLSGGERSMTAVALLFAIYMVKPSPFCVLDELDAPLDESNITRFIRVLDRFIGDSQFVIVTHSKRTMSRADVMYGVSMEEFGVSKTVGVKFSKAEEASPQAKKAVAIGG